MVYAAFVPAFAKAGHRAELKQTFRHVDKWARFANARQNVRGSLF